MTGEKFTLRSAVYLILIDSGKVLLLRRFQTGWEDGKYTLIAGHLDGDETIAETMAREAKEEAGIEIEPSDLEVVHTMHRKSDKEYIDFFLTIKKWQGTPEIKEENKCDDMQWFPLDNLPENILPHVKTALENYNKGVSFSEYGW
jgi:8-oxo-dGTP diphosphatase